MAELPTISVILPVHNGERWLDGCLASLLAQTILAGQCGASRALRVR